MIKKKNTTALSEVVSVVIIIGLVVASVAIIWVVLNQVIKGELGKAGTCNPSEIIDKIKIEDRFTCYNAVSKTLMVSIDVGNLDVEGFLVSIATQGTSKSFEIRDQVQVNGVTNNDGTATLDFPGKNSGRTYTVNLNDVGLATETPDIVRIAPIINDEQCGEIDTIVDIPLC